MILDESMFVVKDITIWGTSTPCGTHCPWPRCESRQNRNWDPQPDPPNLPHGLMSDLPLKLSLKVFRYKTPLKLASVSHLVSSGSRTLTILCIKRYLTALGVIILGLVVLIIARILCVSYLNPAKFNRYDVSLFLENSVQCYSRLQ